MMEEIAKLHAKVLPNTLSSRMGIKYLSWLYTIVSKIGYVKIAKRQGKIVGVISGLKGIILTLAVDPVWQGKGIGRNFIYELKGVQYVYTEKHNVGFYTKLGFIKIWQMGKTIFLCRK